MMHRNFNMDPIATDPLLSALVAEQPHPLVFVTVSGAHLYGFPSPDSDVDLRAAHVLPGKTLFGLDEPKATEEYTGIRQGREVDLVSHDVRKFFHLLLKKNGYVLEQLCSPLVVHSSPWHQELLALVPGCLTKHHSHHYRGFATTQWQLFHKERPRRVKPLLYVYRVLLTGIHLLRTGEVEAHLPTLNQFFRLSSLDDLIECKRRGPEKGALPDADLALHEGEYERLLAELEAAAAGSSLPEYPSAREGLEDLLVRLRLWHLEGA